MPRQEKDGPNVSHVARIKKTPTTSHLRGVVHLPGTHHCHAASIVAPEHLEPPGHAATRATGSLALAALSADIACRRRPTSWNPKEELPVLSSAALVTSSNARSY